MLKEFIEHIQRTTQPLIQEVEGRTFCVTWDGSIEEIRPTIDHPDTLPLHSLDALVKLIKTEAVAICNTLYITIPDHMTVDCFAKPDADKRFFRQFFYQAKATDVPGWESKQELGFEEAQIAMRTRFQETIDIAYLQKLLSEITTGAKVTLNDNGIATSIVTQKGVALQSNESIKPIVSLRPYRTFQEVAQPESPFLIRVNERRIAFIEADGGMWKLKARETIKAFLEDKLSGEVDNGSVVIAL